MQLYSFRWCCESAISIMRGKLMDLNVMTANVNKQLFTVALHHIYSGPFVDAEVRRRKWWYLGRFKERVACLMYALKKERHPSRKLKLSYVEPCEGCSKCVQVPVVSKIRSHWWNMFVKTLYSQPKRKWF
ncbi:unnamed protein product [Soboliphyme baturini]|uniref:Transposase n=1 Tax=Soboliphyme baturini TaxID=241478 RepID=A0A183J6J1_9BILA|nr:unnamed protein product [Soboliphyme baturini]